MTATTRISIITWLLFLPGTVGMAEQLSWANETIEPCPPKVPAAMPDVAELLSPSAIHIDGWLGERIARNEKNRLLVVDIGPLLAGYHKRPGSHPWIGEHIGKWMHAATLAWVYTRDPALREKLDCAAANLIACQEPDGYLGTYIPAKRFSLSNGADWDVWSHKYNLIGLLTYYEYTGNTAALDACRRMGDLLIATFPAKKSILAAGTHMGMAATSVLEPIVLLYRATGERRYLDFAQYIVKSWDEPGGPKILTTLLSTKQVQKTANGKAYEMLSNLVGLCELARATDDRRMLEAVVNAWQDIVAKRLYFTGSASSFEHFHDDFLLPNGVTSNICETCVTTTWIQLNLQLLRLTGKAKYGDEIERALYNHLAAAQHPRGDDWCYYTALEGKKQFDKQITCCHSSGPRGMALAPQAAYLRSHDSSGDTLLVSTFETSRATIMLGGQRVTVEQSSEFPHKGTSLLTLRLKKSAAFAVKFRLPEWALPADWSCGKDGAREGGWVACRKQLWKDGDVIHLKFHLSGKLVKGEHGNANRAALTWGPFVLAYDDHLSHEYPPAETLRLIDAPLVPEMASASPLENLQFAATVGSTGGNKPVVALFVPFASAGANGSNYRVWLRAPGDGK